MTTTILGIETSCDETAAAVVRDGTEVLSSIVSSQADIHSKYGGVVPEIASRMHTEAIMPIIAEALAAAGTTTSGIDAVAVTMGPGLIGCLLVGVAAAKAAAYALGVPLIGTDHLEAHLASIHLERKVGFPFIGLVVSGGHTNLYLAHSGTEYEPLGRTRDDAAGEAFDKAAKLLGLPYPGGVEIDRRAAAGRPDAVDFPRPLLRDPSCDFSFSGLKTALLYHIRGLDGIDDSTLADLCASFQEAIVETLVAKTIKATTKHGIPRVVIAGGVASNSRLRELAGEVLGESGIELHIPSAALCTDNAAMVAALGYNLLSNGARTDMRAAPYSTSRRSYSRGAR